MSQKRECVNDRVVAKMNKACSKAINVLLNLDSKQAAPLVRAAAACPPPLTGVNYAKVAYLQSMRVCCCFIHNDP